MGGDEAFAVIWRQGVAGFVSRFKYELLYNGVNIGSGYTTAIIEQVIADMEAVKAAMLNAVPNREGVRWSNEVPQGEGQYWVYCAEFMGCPEIVNVRLRPGNFDGSYLNGHKSIFVSDFRVYERVVAGDTEDLFWGPLTIPAGWQR